MNTLTRTIRFVIFTLTEYARSGRILIELLRAQQLQAREFRAQQGHRVAPEGQAERCVVEEDLLALVGRGQGQGRFEGELVEVVEREGRVERPARGVGGRRHVCNPHSVLSLPAQRPALASSPSATGRVHGAHPMEA